MSRARHDVCKPGAAVRLHGYAPARVEYLETVYTGPHYDRGTVYAHCIVTGRGPNRSAGRIGPHGYRPGERVTVRACEAVPRDIIRVSRQHTGALTWPAFDVEGAP